jgi:hypothetical protein
LQAANLDSVIKNLKQPVLGICVGMQLLCTHSEEEDTTGWGIVPIAVRRFRATGSAGEALGAGSGRLNGDLIKLKVPQVAGTLYMTSNQNCSKTYRKTVTSTTFIAISPKTANTPLLPAVME